MGHRREPEQWPPKRWPPWIARVSWFAMGLLTAGLLITVINVWLPVLFSLRW